MKMRRQSGFTLIEIVLALVVLVLILGMAIPATSALYGNEPLRDASRKFKIFSRTARLQAVSKGKAMQIRLVKGGFELATREQPDDILEHFVLEEDVGWLIKFWEDKKWRSPDGEVWAFESSGLCDPLRVRFFKDDSYIELNMDPLTAIANDETFELH